MQRVDITHDFTLPIERVYAYLSEHENLEPLGIWTWQRLRHPAFNSVVCAMLGTIRDGAHTNEVGADPAS